MTRKLINHPDKSKPLKPSIKKHFKALDVKNEREYFAWCQRRNFAPSLDKTRDDMEGERDALTNERMDRYEHMRVHHNPERFLYDACLGNINPESITRHGWREVAIAVSQACTSKSQKKDLAEFLLQIHKQAKFVFEETSLGTKRFLYIYALINIYKAQSHWIRDINGWSPKTHNMNGQFLSLLDYLFADYPVPEFMSSVWFRTDIISADYRNWYIHVASGKNIRNADLHVPFTKKMAHHFMQAPDYCSIENAIKWAVIIASGGDERLAGAVIGSRIAESRSHHDFWVTVYRFFIENPMLDRSHVGPLIDYLYVQKFEVRECVTAPGVVEHIQPPQPNLSMKGRTAESLLRQVERWHGDLSKSTDAQKYFFKKSDIPEYRQKTGENKQDIWLIRELLSGAELIKEGREMRHCVASYARACATGRCSIWTMEYMTPTGITKHQTIEVNSDKTIVQARGKSNRYPTKSEFSIIQKWAKTVELSIAPYVISR